MTTRTLSLLTTILACGAVLMAGSSSKAAANWPAGQLLPSLSTPASTQDLISLVQDYSYQATASTEGHATGHNDGDGWLCQTGIDTPNTHMIYGPYDTSLPAGPNVATFSMKVDNNTADNAEICVIDVNDATTGTIIATQTITRQQFTAASQYVTFNLPFTIPAIGHSMEFRVWWAGTSYLKVNHISLQRSSASESAVLFSTLKGLVNSTQPRIFAYDGNSLNEEGQFTWLNDLGLGYTQITDNWSEITKYKSEIKGVVVYDDNQPDTINLATTIAAQKHAVVAPPLFLNKITAAPYSLPILVDLRGKYTSKLAVYQDLYNTYWSGSTHRAIVGLSPSVHFGAAREYASAINAAVIWLDPRVSAENSLLGSFLSSMGPGAVYCGWWPEEQSGVSAASTYGIATCASDWSTNLSVFSGTSRAVAVKQPPSPPALQNKIYLAFVVSDGDNLQYVEHRFRRLWSDPNRGKVPLGWTLSPVMLDAMPGCLNSVYSTASANDCLLSGPSGYGYTYPNNWANATYLNNFVSKSADYCNRAGFKIITVWNTINGGINANVGSSYAQYASTLLGLTAQNAGAGLTIYNNNLPSMAFAANYCPTIASVNMQITNNSAGWSGTSPLFLIIQCQPWGDITPTGLMNIKNGLNSNYVVVRPDTIFQLIRQANHLTVNPTAPGPSIACGNATQGSFVADTDFSGGSISSGTTSTINLSKVTNPAPMSVYQHGRKGTCTYSIPNLTAGAAYTVRLHFCEYAANAAGQRKFNVAINGSQVLTNFDTYATAGGEFVANVQSFHVTANSSGQIVINFTTVLNNALVQGIEVMPGTV